MHKTAEVFEKYKSLWQYISNDTEYKKSWNISKIG